MIAVKYLCTVICARVRAAGVTHIARPAVSTSLQQPPSPFTEKPPPDVNHHSPPTPLSSGLHLPVSAMHRPPTPPAVHSYAKAFVVAAAALLATAMHAVFGVWYTRLHASALDRAGVLTPVAPTAPVWSTAQQRRHLAHLLANGTADADGRSASSHLVVRATPEHAHYLHPWLVAVSSVLSAPLAFGDSHLSIAATAVVTAVPGQSRQALFRMLAHQFMQRAMRPALDDAEVLHYTKIKSQHARIWFFHWLDHDACEALRFYDGMHGCDTDADALQARAQLITSRVRCTVDLSDPGPDVLGLCSLAGVAAGQCPTLDNNASLAEDNELFDRMYKTKHLFEMIKPAIDVLEVLANELHNKKCRSLQQAPSSSMPLETGIAAELSGNQSVALSLASQLECSPASCAFLG